MTSCITSPTSTTIHKRRNTAARCLAICLVVLFATQAHAGDASPRNVRVWQIGRVSAGFPVGFSLLTTNAHQFVAYYDENHRMTIAGRSLDDDHWHRKTLDATVGWDTHNYVTIAVDPAGCLHVSGNMHGHPLVYFRSKNPWDISTLKPIHHMVGAEEDRCTYPVFLNDAQGRLIFFYRDGGSGNGKRIFNRYDESTKTWRRLLDQPLLDGRGQMNAYPAGPRRGPDGYFPLAWVWRDTPDCRTNHDVSYVRSRDLIHWETIAGKPIDLPITIDTPGVIVDPVPTGGGMINSNLAIGFDTQGRPILSYHKFDHAGHTQAWVARYQNNQWVRREITRWEYRWAFEGYGAIGSEIRIGAVKPLDTGRLAMAYTHIKHGRGRLVLDEQSLQPLGHLPPVVMVTTELEEPRSDFPRMRVRWVRDRGRSPDLGTTYLLRWETLPANRDQKPQGPLPEPSTLELYRVEARPNETD